MHQQLEKILAQKQKEVAKLRNSGPRRQIKGPQVQRDFKTAISDRQKISLIAEIKFASPSAGLICEKSDPVSIGRIYEDAGAAAISLLTDQAFFKGDIGCLPQLKEVVSLPILRKDFIIDPVQIEEALHYGADAVLLIARILSRIQLTEMISICRELGIEALVEIHDKGDLETAVSCGAEIIGINNRDLDSFNVDIQHTLDLAPLVPDNCAVVSESGIINDNDIQTLKSADINAVLVGTALMRSDDLAGKTTELVMAG